MNPTTHLDGATRFIIATTLVLFAAALLVKGFSHDILLEAGVFLVSVKLVLLAYHTSVATADARVRLDALSAALARVEHVLATRGQ